MKKTLLASVVALGMAGAAVADTPPPDQPAPAPAPSAAVGPVAQPKVGPGPAAKTDPWAPPRPIAGNRAALSQKMLAALELTEAQQTRITALQTAFDERTATLRGELRAQGLLVFRMRDAAQADPKALDTERAKLEALQQKLKGEIETLDAEVVAVLDERQKAQYQKMREETKTARPMTFPPPRQPNAPAAPPAPPPAGG
jgi:Spy/CpxP family protein refolding chaperone